MTELTRDKYKHTHTHTHTCRHKSNTCRNYDCVYCVYCVSKPVQLQRNSTLFWCTFRKKGKEWLPFPRLYKYVQSAALCISYDAFYRYVSEATHRLSELIGRTWTDMCLFCCDNNRHIGHCIGSGISRRTSGPLVLYPTLSQKDISANKK